MAEDYRVRPGDLITAELWNGLVDQLSILESRVEVLEQSGPIGSDLVITDVVFSGAVLRAGNQVTLVGRNFGSAQVTLDDVAVIHFLRGTDNEHLVFTVPSLPNLQSPRLATFHVVNPHTGGSADRMVTVHPAEPRVEGTLFPEWIDADPKTLKANELVRLFYTVGAELTGPAAFTIEPFVEGPSWPVEFEVLDENGVALPGAQLNLGVRDTKQFSVRFRIPAETDGTPFDVGVNFMHGNRAFSVFSTTGFIVGEPIPKVDPNIDFTYLDDFTRNPITDTASNVEGDRISVAGTSTVALLFRLIFRPPDSRTFPIVYQISVEPKEGTTGWQMGVTPPKTEFTIDRNEIGQPQQLRVFVKRGAQSVAGEMIVRVREKGLTTPNQTRRFTLALL